MQKNKNSIFFFFLFLLPISRRFATLVSKIFNIQVKLFEKSRIGRTENKFFVVFSVSEEIGRWSPVVNQRSERLKTR